MIEWVHTSPKLDPDFVSTVEEALSSLKLSKRRLKIAPDINMTDIEYKILFDTPRRAAQFKLALDNITMLRAHDPRRVERPQRLRRRRQMVLQPNG